MMKYTSIINSYKQGGFVLMFISFLYNAIEGIIVGLISLPFVIVIHELGHLLSGRISGYQFISLRLLLFQWVKDENDQIKFTRVTSLLGMGGQCLMKPLHKEEDFTYKLYNLGGSLLNLITGMFLIVPLFIFGQTFTRWLFIAGVVSIFMAVANLIPSSSGGLPNDGRNVKEANKSEDAKRGFYVMLKANGEMALGKKLSELDEDLFKTNEDADVNNYFVAFTILLHAAYLEEVGKYQESYQQLLRLESTNLPSVYKAQALLGLLFNELIYQGDEKAKEKAQERWTATEKDRDTLSIIETLKHPGFMIPYAAKVAILDDDIMKASKLANEARKLIPSLQNPGTEHLAQLNLEHLAKKLPEITLEEVAEETKKSKSKKEKEEITKDSLEELAKERTEEITKESSKEIKAKESSKEIKAKEEITSKDKPVITKEGTKEKSKIERIKEEPKETPPPVEKASPPPVATPEKKSYFPPPVIHPEEKLYVPPVKPKEEKKLYVPPATQKEEKKLYVPPATQKEEEKLYVPPTTLEVEEELYVPPTTPAVEEKVYVPPTIPTVEEKVYVPPTTSTVEEDKPLSPAQIIENLTSEILGEISGETSENTSDEARDKNFEDIMNQFKNRS